MVLPSFEQKELGITCPPKRNYSGLTVLLADDEEEIREGFGTFLMNLGFQVLLAEDGEQAIELIKRQNLDLIITDIKMPNKDGMDVFYFARKAQSSVPVIFVTAFGYDYRHKIAKAKMEGLKNVFLKSKPINLVHLEKIICKVLKKKLEK